MTEGTVMDFSQTLNGAALTVALPLGLLAAVVLWGFFERHPGARFGGLSKAGGPLPVGRPDIETADGGPELGGSGPE